VVQKSVESVDTFVSLNLGGEKRFLFVDRCSVIVEHDQDPIALWLNLGSGGYAQIGMAAPNNGMATSSELNAAYSTGMQAYLSVANAALSNPNAFQTYGSNTEPSSPLTINMDQSVYSPGDLAQAFGNSLLQSGALPNPSVWVPQSQELYDAAAGRFWGGLQLVGGAAEAVSGLAIGTAGTATEAGTLGATTPVSVPAMVVGAALAANGADNMWAGLQSLWSGQPTETYTQQAITAVTGSPTAGLWGNVAIGMAGGNWEEAGAAAGESAADTVVRFGPHMEGPLPESISSTFRGGSYSQTTLGSDTTLYRVYGGESGQLSPWWSRTPPSGPLQSQTDLALPPGNTAQNLVQIRVPAGTTLYERAAEANFGRLGGGNQVFIPNVNPAWVVNR
jgi:hypothetical protein